MKLKRIIARHRDQFIAATFVLSVLAFVVSLYNTLSNAHYRMLAIEQRERMLTNQKSMLFNDSMAKEVRSQNLQIAESLQRKLDSINNNR